MLPWNERITMLSINPDAASRDDIARLATELMECRDAITEAIENCETCRGEQKPNCARCVTFGRLLDGRAWDQRPEGKT